MSIRTLLDLRLPALDSDFYEEDDPPVAARSLIGKLLWSRVLPKAVDDDAKNKSSEESSDSDHDGPRDEECVSVCQLVEVEGYGQSDGACHGAGYKITPRNKHLFNEGGHAYVYTCYGQFQLLNLTFGPEGEPIGCLCRGAIPIAGVDLMLQRREVHKGKVETLLRGPGLLGQAMGIARSFNGTGVTSSIGKLWVTEPPTRKEWMTAAGDAEPPPLLIFREDVAKLDVGESARIGLGKGTDEADALLPWRMFVRKCSGVSSGTIAKPRADADLEETETAAATPSTTGMRKKKRRVTEIAHQ